MLTARSMVRRARPRISPVSLAQEGVAWLSGFLRGSLVAAARGGGSDGDAEMFVLAERPGPAEASELLPDQVFGDFDESDLLFGAVDQEGVDEWPFEGADGFESVGAGDEDAGSGVVGIEADADRGLKSDGGDGFDELLHCSGVDGTQATLRDDDAGGVHGDDRAAVQGRVGRRRVVGCFRGRGVREETASARSGLGRAMVSSRCRRDGGD